MNANVETVEVNLKCKGITQILGDLVVSGVSTIADLVVATINTTSVVTETVMATISMQSPLINTTTVNTTDVNATTVNTQALLTDTCNSINYTGGTFMLTSTGTPQVASIINSNNFPNQLALANLDGAVDLIVEGAPAAAGHVAFTPGDTIVASSGSLFLANSYTDWAAQVDTSNEVVINKALHILPPDPGAFGRHFSVRAHGANIFNRFQNYDDARCEIVSQAGNGTTGTIGIGVDYSPILSFKYLNQLVTDTYLWSTPGRMLIGPEDNSKNASITIDGTDITMGRNLIGTTAEFSTIGCDGGVSSFQDLLITNDIILGNNMSMNTLNANVVNASMTGSTFLDLDVTTYILAGTVNADNVSASVIGGGIITMGNDSDAANELFANGECNFKIKSNAGEILFRVEATGDTNPGSTHVTWNDSLYFANLMTLDLLASDVTIGGPVTCNDLTCDTINGKVLICSDTGLNVIHQLIASAGASNLEIKSDAGNLFLSVRSAIALIPGSAHMSWTNTLDMHGMLTMDKLGDKFECHASEATFVFARAQALIADTSFECRGGNVAAELGPTIILSTTAAALPHAIRTYHTSGDAENNRIEFSTCDGTISGSTFPTNYIHGMTIDNGRVGCGTGHNITLGAYPLTTNLIVENDARVLGTITGHILDATDKCLIPTFVGDDPSPLDRTLWWDNTANELKVSWMGTTYGFTHDNSIHLTVPGNTTLIGNVQLGAAHTQPAQNTISIRAAGYRQIVSECTLAGNSSFIEMRDTLGTRSLFGCSGAGLVAGPLGDTIAGNFSSGDFHLHTNARRLTVEAAGDIKIANSLKLGTLAADPSLANSVDGQMYYSTSEHKLKVHVDGDWLAVATV